MIMTNIILIMLTLIAIALAVLALTIAKRYHDDAIEYLDNLNVAQEEDNARMNRLWQDLQQTKERVNADLTEHNKRLNRHRDKLVRDYNRLLIIDQKLKENL